jgi:hypothetical protein
MAICMDLTAPALHDKLWHSMRADLARYAPQIADNDRLMCCCCGRFLPKSDFDLEHIIPQIAVGDDPPEIRELFTVNERSKTLLLCKRPLTIKGVPVHPKGCNNWKGRFFDARIREIMNGRALQENKYRPFSSQHQAALMALAYLALVHQYGYQIALTPSGQLMRRQFFHPGSLRNELSGWPWGAVLSGQPFGYDPTNLNVWINPFSFGLQSGRCIVCIRHVSVFVPLSRNPETPIASQIKFVPSRFTMKPNFRTLFDA